MAIKNKIPKKIGEKIRTRKNSVNPVIAGATGAAVGAGLGVAATVLMNNEKNRKKVEKVVNTVKKQATEYLETVKNDGLKKGKQIVNKTVSATAKDVKKKVNQQTAKLSSKGKPTKSTHSAATAHR